MAQLTIPSCSLMRNSNTYLLYMAKTALSSVLCSCLLVAFLCLSVWLGVALCVFTLCMRHVYVCVTKERHFLSCDGDHHHRSLFLIALCHWRTSIVWLSSQCPVLTSRCQNLESELKVHLLACSEASDNTTTADGVLCCGCLNFPLFWALLVFVGLKAELDISFLTADEEEEEEEWTFIHPFGEFFCSL